MMAMCPHVFQVKEPGCDPVDREALSKSRADQTPAEAASREPCSLRAAADGAHRSWVVSDGDVPSQRHGP